MEATESQSIEIDGKRTPVCKHPYAKDRPFSWLICCRCGVQFIDGTIQQTAIKTAEDDTRDKITRLSSYSYPKD